MASEIEARRSQVMYRVGGREYPMKTNRQCKVCMSPYRMDIEEHLIGGRTYKRIAQSLPDDAELTDQNVKNHFLNGHLPLEQSVVRETLERRAEQIGKRIEDETESLIDGIALAQVVVQKSWESVAKGEVTPDLKDGMAAAKFLAEMGEYDNGGMDMTAMTEAFIIYHQNAQEHMTPEQFAAFGRALDRNPALKALAAKYNPDGTPKQPVQQGESS